jgi:hypothetical protein
MTARGAALVRTVVADRELEGRLRAPPQPLRAAALATIAGDSARRSRSARGATKTRERRCSDGAFRDPARLAARPASMEARRRAPSFDRSCREVGPLLPAS